MKPKKISDRALRQNIWRVALSATSQEIHEGVCFYPGAHGLCHAIALALSIPVETVVGLYAVLSPNNNWESNVANIIDIVRHRELASVNTYGANKRKALRILNGEKPLSVIRGKKVTAFYNAILDDRDHNPIPVDRHLINAALGEFHNTKALSRLSSSNGLYSRIESAYHQLGRRERLGNRFASIVWFAQRRIERTGQMQLNTSPLYCCNRPMSFTGKFGKFYCPDCGTRVDYSIKRGPRYIPVDRLILDADDREHLITSGYKLWLNADNRPCVSLPIVHPYSNVSGYNYLARYLLMLRSGEPLHKDEHVHHINGNVLDNRFDNLEVMLCERHGRLHARHQLLYLARDLKGRWLKAPDMPKFSEMVHGNPDYDIPF